MVAIVLIHCCERYISIFNIAKMPWFCQLIIQTSKFGTIVFFIVSGFLAGDKLGQGTPIAYMKKRLQVIFKPWLLWFILTGTLVAMVHLREAKHIVRSWHDVAGATVHYAEIFLFHTPFWYVPNLLVALTFLLLLRHFFDGKKIPILLMLISLAYGFNIYTHWVGTSQTEAVLGFAFYLWLGMWAAQSRVLLDKWLSNVPIWSLVSLAILAWFAGIEEAHVLTRLATLDEFNTLRISNQLYSVAVMLVILKFRRSVSPGVIDPRATTFGVYLTHTMVLGSVAAVLKHSIPYLSSSTFWTKAEGGIILTLAIFSLTYAISLSLTLFLQAHPKLRWTVGDGAMTRRIHPPMPPMSIASSSLDGGSLIAPEGSGANSKTHWAQWFFWKLRRGGEQAKQS